MQRQFTWKPKLSTKYFIKCPTSAVTEKQNVYVYIGGSPTSHTTSNKPKTGGYNGGGNSGGSYDMGTPGGGATDIRIVQDSLYARVIVSGGGGGVYYSMNQYYSISAGVGGGTFGTAGSSNGSSYPGGTGGSISSPGISYTGSSSVNSTNYGTPAIFGNGGTATSSYTAISGGGGGWYGGGYSFQAGAGGGSGWVYTESNFNTWKSENPTDAANWLLNSSYYLTDANSYDGTQSFTNVDGTGTETGHSGDGAAKITGTEQVTTSFEVTTYLIPRVLGIETLNVTLGSTIDLSSGVSIECAEGETNCSLISVPNVNTSTLSEGTHKVEYIVKDANNKKYKYERTVIVS